MAEPKSIAPPALTSVPASNPGAQPISPVSTPTTSGIAALATASQQFLKPTTSPRKRRRSPETSAVAVAVAGRRKSLSPVSPKTATFPPPPVTLTGAAEMAEKRRKLDNESRQPPQTSENPTTKALGNLMGLQDGMSKPEDAPTTAAAAATTLSAPVAAIAPTITIPEKDQNNANQQPSPASTKSVSTMESTGATTITASGPRVASPSQLVEEEEREQVPSGQKRTAEMANGEGPNKSSTYPGPLYAAQMGDGRRGMSLPGNSSSRDESKSPSSNKKHKCPYCSTEFTRHHNLKSHLLTHSHEKPYLCQTCDSRFRRLHDLKRHTKLHTGERPHVCPKCNRSFARGDALARHNKGQGGCAGRRSSAGSFGGDPGDESIDMMYTTGDASQEPENMDDEGDGADRPHLPSIRRHEPSNHLQPESQGPYQRTPSTYPPVAARAPMNPSNLYPPAGQHVPSGGQTSPSSASPHMNFPPSGAYPNNSGYGPQMTESPKPLSPSTHHPLSAGDPRNRSPSLSSQLAGQPYRRQSTRTTPPPTLPPPHPSVPTLLPPHTLPPPEPRYSVSSASGGPPQVGGPLPSQSGSYPGPPSAGSNSLSSHGTGGPNSGDRNALPFGNEERLWALVKSLESKVERLESEVASLRTQLHQQQQPSPSVSQAPQPGPAR